MSQNVRFPKARQLFTAMLDESDGARFSSVDRSVDDYVNWRLHCLDVGAKETVKTQLRSEGITTVCEMSEVREGTSKTQQGITLGMT